MRCHRRHLHGPLPTRPVAIPHSCRLTSCTCLHTLPPPLPRFGRDVVNGVLRALSTVSSGEPASSSPASQPQKRECTHCGARMSPTSKFCGDCGLEGPVDGCTHCGAHMSSTSKFCGDCGKPADAVTKNVPWNSSEAGAATTSAEDATTNVSARRHARAAVDGKPRRTGRQTTALAVFGQQVNVGLHWFGPGHQHQRARCRMWTAATLSLQSQCIALDP